MAFQEAESPNGDNVVVFLNLALFWYSVGQFRRANMLSSLSHSYTQPPLHTKFIHPLILSRDQVVRRVPLGF